MSLVAVVVVEVVVVVGQEGTKFYKYFCRSSLGKCKVVLNVCYSSLLESCYVDFTTVVVVYCKGNKCYVVLVALVY